MKEIVDLLMENRKVELAKSILESSGYKVSKILYEEDNNEIKSSIVLDDSVYPATKNMLRNLSNIGLYCGALNTRDEDGSFDFIVASTVTYKNDRGEDCFITTPGRDDGTGIVVYFYGDLPALFFYEINSINPGMGTKMVDAIIGAIRGIDLLYPIRVHHDFSGGFWEKMANKYSQYEWNLK